MTYTIRVRQRAEADIKDARAWYGRIERDLAHRFGQELGDALESILRDPLRYPRVYRDVRRVMTKHFPYAVYFVVNDNRVSVLRVLHQARDPREWQRQ